MFARLSTITLVVTLFAGAIAAPMEYKYEQCNGGQVQCCNSVGTKESLYPEHKRLLTLVGVKNDDVTGLVGIGCYAVKAAALGSSSQW